MRLFRARNSWEALGAFLHLGDALAAETLCLAGFEVKMKGWDGHGFWSLTNRAIWALQMVGLVREIPLISGKSRLVKYYSIWPDGLDRMGWHGTEPHC